ncbi:hypothetical protein F4813DRAFT_371660 [Daldinia decipiens]|uniref:uncharacterized protein n=1 Tax=Daldinia decipiens TaxID=326647 RepID=UPI0020C51076|nr:uncharacterized protein F4813DRAFT_371660 [Daldinia decipiens]KAI1654150.1 hypothetical protein F4813DRAFT_371660 [Daldinia decipiens]
MCVRYIEWYHCYECQHEFNHRVVLRSCAKAATESCMKVTQQRDVVLSYETCITCKMSRRAEEICQQKIYRQVPLYYTVRDGWFIRENFW